MTLIYPPENDPMANEVAWFDVTETAWVRIELTDCECVYRPLTPGQMLDGRLVVEYLTPELAMADDYDGARRAVFTRADGQEWAWDFSYDVYVPIGQAWPPVGPDRAPPPRE